MITSAFGSGSLKKSPDAVRTRSAQPGGGDVLLRDGLDRRQIEADALDVRMPLRDFDAEQAGRAADIAERLIAREIELLGERFEVDARQAGHRAEELLELRRVGVELLEHAFLPPCLISFCGCPGAQRFRQIVPELEQPRVEHLQNAADVARAAAIEIKSAGGRVEILRVGAVAFALEEFHRHERIEKIGDAARMQFEFFPELRAGEPALAERREDTELDRGEQDLRIPEAEGGLQNGVRCWRSCLSYGCRCSQSARSHK